MTLAGTANAAASTTLVSPQLADREKLIRRRLESVKTRTTAVAAREFFSSSSSSDALDDDDTDIPLDWRSLPGRIRRLCEVLEGWTAEGASSLEELPYRFSTDPVEARRIAMTAAVMATATSSSKSSQPHCSHQLNSAFESLFRACIHERHLCRRWQRMEDGNDGEEEEEEEEEDDEELIGTDELAELALQGRDLASNLRTLGWIRPGGLLRTAFVEAVRQSLLKKTRDAIAGDYESTGLFGRIEAWRDAVVAPWLIDVLGNAAFDKEGWTRRLDRMAAECFCRVRMDELFDVVAEYPDSHAAVLELRDVHSRTGEELHAQVGQVLRASLIRRLNHPGANTSQIIDVYIATIKVLRILDPSENLLGLVAEPVRQYLRGRSDTVRCIITSLTNAEVGGDLYEELRRQDAKPLENVTVDSDDEEECPTFDWQPPPSIHKQPRMLSLLDGGGRRGGCGGGGGGGGGDGDILAMLVSIYGSKELFVDEYRLMLADKLLTNLDYNTDTEVHTLELLKLRFGDISMRNCEVMIKDMDDSKRANANIHSTLEQSTTRQRTAKPVTDVAMVSHIFWPTLQQDPLKHHPRIQAELDEFSAEYARLKNPRKLVWLDQLGTVQIELDVVEDDPEEGEPVVETKEFTCTPLLATLISHFEDKQLWSVEDLSNETGVAEHILQKKMTYWVNNRVVRIVGQGSGGGPVYELATPSHLQEGGAYRDHHADAMMMDEDMGDQAVSVSAQEEEEILVYESYIMGMLTNLQQLPLERIHNMLKMFCSSGSDNVKYNKTPQQLSAFLQHLCKQEKLECGPDGMYKLFKK